MRKKIRLLSVSIVALALTGPAAVSASATQWLVGGSAVEEAQSSPWHETIIIVHEKGSLGKAKVECRVLLIGTVGPGAEDKVTLVEGFSGEKDLISDCVSTEGFCLGPIVHPVGLPWDTKLLLEGTKTVDDYLSYGWLVLCSFGVQVECKGNGKTEFTGNDSDGALFAQLGKAGGITSCSDGGEGWLEGTANGLKLGATVS